jgi:hypothetical protein
VKAPLPILLLIGVATATACGGHAPSHHDVTHARTAQATTSTSTSTSTSAAAQATTPLCPRPTAADIASVGGPRVQRAEPLAKVRGIPRTCATLFIDGSGGLILQVTVTTGGARALAGARRAARAQTTRIRALPHLPSGFIAGTVAAFLHGGRLITLTAGYSTSGELELTPKQLARLASIAAAGQ